MSQSAELFVNCLERSSSDSAEKKENRNRCSKMCREKESHKNKAWTEETVHTPNIIDDSMLKIHSSHKIIMYYITYFILFWRILKYPEV